MIAALDGIVAAAAGWIWGLPLLMLVSGGGAYFFVRSRLLPFRYLPHAVGVLTGRYDRPDDPGLVTHYRALSVALASTIGMGNIAGVAIAIAVGGPGAIFWMWISAILGMATKFFEVTAALLYRGRDEFGQVQGGPMYAIVEGMGARWRPLAVLFCVAACFGALPVFNANQLTDAVQAQLLGGDTGDLASGFLVGLVLTAGSAIVVFGGLSRIAAAASAVVPVMTALYVLAVLGILVIHAGDVPGYLALIVQDAFAARYYDGDALFGGALGGLIVLGARRAAFSNEAGLGTAAMAHGAAKTAEPVQEGLVAMLGPVIDTLIVCTMTALAILVTGVWQDAEGLGGAALTLAAFEVAYPGVGGFVLLLCIIGFAGSSLFAYSYYGQKSFAFLFGTKRVGIYNAAYVASILIGSVASISLAVNFFDFMFAMMAIPTMISTLVLSPKVAAAARDYFARSGAAR